MAIQLSDVETQEGSDHQKHAMTEEESHLGTPPAGDDDAQQAQDVLEEVPVELDPSPGRGRALEGGWWRWLGRSIGLLAIDGISETVRQHQQQRQTEGPRDLDAVAKVLGRQGRPCSLHESIRGRSSQDAGGGWMGHGWWGGRGRRDDGRMALKEVWVNVSPTIPISIGFLLLLFLSDAQVNDVERRVCAFHLQRLNRNHHRMALVRVLVRPDAPDRADAAAADGPSEARQRIDEARAALVASLSSVGASVDSDLRGRARNLHSNAAVLKQQQVDVGKQTAALHKQADQLQQVADRSTVKLKEIGDVQNWAEMIERDLLRVEETLRMVEERRELDDDDDDNHHHHHDVRPSNGHI